MPAVLHLCASLQCNADTCVYAAYLPVCLLSAARTPLPTATHCHCSAPQARSLQMSSQRQLQQASQENVSLKAEVARLEGQLELLRGDHLQVRACLPFCLCGCVLSACVCPVHMSCHACCGCDAL